MLFSLEKCITAVNGIPEKYDYYILKSQDSVKYDGIIEASYTVKELKLAIDPFNDYSLVKHMGKEMDEFINMFYEPCLSDLFGMNVGINAGTDPMYFMSESWYNHESCSKLSCLADNMRWDRQSNQGCVPSLINGEDAADFEADENSNGYCQKDVSNDGSSEECVHNSNELSEYSTKAKSCWNNDNSRVKSPVYIMDHFCNPVITNDIANEEQQANIMSMEAACS